MDARKSLAYRSVGELMSQRRTSPFWQKKNPFQVENGFVLGVFDTGGERAHRPAHDTRAGSTPYKTDGGKRQSGGTGTPMGLPLTPPDMRDTFAQIGRA